VTNFAHGRAAEAAAAAYLKKQKYKIVAQNWRVPRAEIDIVAQKKRLVLFCEVKYRETNNQGGGLDYITPRKLEQMQFAAELWVQENNYAGEYALGALEVSGQGYEVTCFLENVI